MNGNSSLIRKLVDATASAEHHGKDVADILKGRCFNDTNLVRQTLMNAVCDPRFKINASLVGFWRDEARKSLEMLAQQLSALQPLTQEAADYMLEDFLTAWFRMNFSEIKRPEPSCSSEHIQNDAEKIKEALDYLESFDDESEELDYDSDEETDIDKDDQEKRETIVPAHKGDDNKKQGEKDADSNEIPNSQSEEEPSHEQDRHLNSKKGYRPRNSHSIQQIEEQYLEKIPNSLIELARRIGRMGDGANQNSGRFLTASKCDIAGITVGNNITAVLPSEVALLAEPSTQDIFYHNYVSRRLQLFASASHSDNPNRHHDGPVIICVDVSSSMGGEPIRVATALAAAVAIVAWRRQRDVFMVKYSDFHEFLDLGHNRSRIGEMAKFLRRADSGGNNENSMFQWLFADNTRKNKKYQNADILCVSDFGWTTLSDKTQQLINEQKEQGMRFYGLNVDTRHAWNMQKIDNDAQQPMQICDSVWTYEKGVCREVKKLESK